VIGRRGTYAGTLSVTADDQKRELPVTLRLLDFDLPDANSLDVMVYYEPSQPEEYQGRNLDAAYHRFAHRHRVELVHAYDETKVRGNAGRFSGADFTKAQGYEGPAKAPATRSRRSRSTDRGRPSETRRSRAGARTTGCASSRRT
jgi:hypothetical protein